MAIIKTPEEAKGRSVYIAGPMSGYPEFNFPAFFAAQKQLEALGWKVWNPAEKDLETVPDIQDNATGSQSEAAKKGFDLRKALAWDTLKITEADAIYMLKGWEHSPGARAEWTLATALQKTFPEYGIMYQ